MRPPDLVLFCRESATDWLTEWPTTTRLEIMVEGVFCSAVFAFSKDGEEPGGSVLLSSSRSLLSRNHLVFDRSFPDLLFDGIPRAMSAKVM